MRFSCKVFLENPANIVIPPDYRSYLLSMIKEAFRLSSDDGNEFFDRVYSGNNSKPFTFSAYIPMKRDGENFKLEDRKDFFSFFFSTSDYEFLMRIYNGLNKIKSSKNFQLFGQNIKEIKHFFLLPEKSFNKDKLVFKTLSPFLVRNPEDGNYYFVPEGLLKGKSFKYSVEVSEKEFINALKKNTVSLVKKYLGKEIEENEINISYANLELSPSIHSSNKSNFRITLPAIKGLLELNTKPEVLKLLYDTGIGARRSEGFGMLEVVK